MFAQITSFFVYGFGTFINGKYLFFAIALRSIIAVED
jgi:hypothetical protein